MENSVDFTQLNIKINNLILKMDIEIQKEIYQYLSQLDELEKKAYNIAINHLESSFNVYKSNGFKEWKLKQNK